MLDRRGARGLPRSPGLRAEGGSAGPLGGGQDPLRTLIPRRPGAGAHRRRPAEHDDGPAVLPHREGRRPGRRRRCGRASRTSRLAQEVRAVPSAGHLPGLRVHDHGLGRGVDGLRGRLLHGRVIT
ncbi:hypothetical protein BLX87_00190 [Bacillus sp. VT-16-64]|nr:hypothetical protein BLX87_00190 [Bacillus sp. VT-16-64]